MMLKRFLSNAKWKLAVIALLTQSSAVLAAQIEVKSDPMMGCDIHLSGTITGGDAETLRQAIQLSDQKISQEAGYTVSGPLIGSRPPKNRRVCFNSPGGSFPEGLLIAELLIESRKGAAVGAGMICESACALAFMGGSTAQSGVEDSDDTDRVLHPTGLLGFHAPSLVVADGQYSEASVSQAYEVALSALRALSATRNKIFRGYVPGTDQATSFRYQFTESLLLAMLSTPPTEMRYLETIGEASRWDIRIGPIDPPTITEPYRRFAAACDNIASFWAEQTEFPFEEPPFISASEGRMAGFSVQASDPDFETSEDTTNGQDQGKKGIKLTADMGEYFYNCTMELFENEGLEINSFTRLGLATFGSPRYFYAFHLLDPETRIDGLSPGSESEMSALVEGLSKEIAGLHIDVPQTCWLSKDVATITNVNEYVNLRRQPDLNAPSLSQVPQGEAVRLIEANAMWFIEAQLGRELCFEACQAVGANQQDTAAADQVRQCIDDNRLWYEITDARGNSGWVSRKFLKEAE